MTNKETICFFNSTKSWGGGEKWHLEMALALFEKGYKVLIITSPNSELYKKVIRTKVPVECLNVFKFSYLSLKKINRVIAFYKKHNVKVVVTNSSEDMKLGGIAAKKNNLKRIIYRRGSAIPIKNSFINRYFFKSVVTEILTNSEATKDTININNANLFPKEKITVIPNGINIFEFEDKDDYQLHRKKGNKLILGNLGRMVYQKNQEFLIAMAVELIKRNIDFKLLIGGNGKLEKLLKNKAKKYNLENQIKFLGFIKKPKDFMNSIDIFLLPSRWEGFGYVIAEAMLCYKPVIAFDISSNSQIIESGTNGFLTKFNDVQVFCDKIEYLYNNPNLLIDMGSKGRHKIEKEFDSKEIQERVINYLIG